MLPGFRVALWNWAIYSAALPQSCLANFELTLPITNLTPSVWVPSFSSLIRSISWLLMPWLLVLPGHQQPWYCLCEKIGKSWGWISTTGTCVMSQTSGNPSVLGPWPMKWLEDGWTFSIETCLKSRKFVGGPVKAQKFSQCLMSVWRNDRNYKY